MTRPGRVLLFEEHQDTAEMLGLILEQRGYSIEIVARHGEIRAVARRFDPDVVLIDVGRRVPSGLDILRDLRDDSRCPDRFVAMLSGWGRAEDIEQARAAGADDYVVKPVALATIEQLVAQARARRKVRD
jgi:DNA-binding response OmpR family regulator